MQLAYDVIGDIHGQYEKFSLLMKMLGYTEKELGFVPPPGHQAIFVGDLIDRGPAQIQLLEAVRSMVQDGHAQVVMGNHEFNAIAYTVEDPDIVTHREFLRKNHGTDWKCLQNRAQHEAFLDQVGEDSKRHHFWVDWFRTLPIALDLNGIRVAHAWWDAQAFALIESPDHRDSMRRLTDEFLIESHRSGSQIKEARKVLTSGYEFKLPPNCYITDKAGHKHDNARLKVWRHDAVNLRDVAIVPKGDNTAVPDLVLAEVLPNGFTPVQGAPIFVGHYWFEGKVTLESDKVAILDWSAARDGPLVAYRWEGEQSLVNDHFVVAAI